MAFQETRLRLGDDEFAFYFSGGAGVKAAELGTFLRQAATTAKRSGVELEVTALEPGSLAVVMRAVGAAVRDEFKATPIKTTAAAVATVSLVVGSLVAAMSGEAKPLAKTAAEIVDSNHAELIQIITKERTIEVMNPERARSIRRQPDSSEKQSRLAVARVSPEMKRLTQEAHIGSLSGILVHVEGVLYFRPDGFRYLVPVDMERSEAVQQLIPQHAYRVNAELVIHRGQPDSIIIHTAIRHD